MQVFRHQYATGVAIGVMRLYAVAGLCRVHFLTTSRVVADGRSDGAE